jgi:hypothetical protein
LCYMPWPFNPPSLESSNYTWRKVTENKSCFSIKFSWNESFGISSIHLHHNCWSGKAMSFSACVRACVRACGGGGSVRKFI